MALSTGPTPLYTLEKLNNKINTRYDEINPVVSLDGSTIYFTRVGHPNFDKTLKVNDKDFSQLLTFDEYSDKLQEIFYQLGENMNSNPVASAFNQDIWIARSENDIFDHIEHPPYPLNSALPNSVCAVTPDPGTIVVINQFFKDGSMQKGFSFVKRDHGKDWTFPEPLFIYDYYDIEADVNLNLSKDNEVMILSLQKPGGIGKHDLYVSFRIHTTLWSAPEHMGEVINTGDNEITPFISDDKQFLFFSSDRPGTSGGQDIFVSERLDDSWKSWSVPKVLPTPINSAADEAQPFLNRITGYLYFTSTRDGSSDIFRVHYQRSKPMNRRKPATGGDRAGHVQVTCLVVDGSTGEPIEAKVSMGPVTVAGFEKELHASKKGFSIAIGNEDVLKFYAHKKGYITRVQKFDFSNVVNKEPIIKLVADPIRQNTKISMDPIFFMRGKNHILSGSFAELDRLASIMNNHPNINITIDGHTDNYGDQWALLQLSESRASAVKEYLMQKGVERHRIKTRGFGSTKPITDNSSEALKAKNRRVEVIITKT